MRDLIAILPPGEGRDGMQKRFDLVIARIAAVPQRVLLQFDAKTIGSNSEFEDCYRMEMLRAINAWDEE
jgi:hypothetical protein